MAVSPLPYYRPLGSDSSVMPWLGQQLPQSLGELVILPLLSFLHRQLAQKAGHFILLLDIYMCLKRTSMVSQKSETPSHWVGFYSL